MSDFDTILENGFVIDGTGAPGTNVDVGIREGEIAKLGSLKSRSAAKLIRLY